MLLPADAVAERRARELPHPVAPPACADSACATPPPHTEVLEDEGEEPFFHPSAHSVSPAGALALPPAVCSTGTLQTVPAEVENLVEELIETLELIAEDEREAAALAQEQADVQDDERARAAAPPLFIRTLLSPIAEEEKADILAWHCCHDVAKESESKMVHAHEERQAEGETDTRVAESSERIALP